MRDRTRVLVVEDSPTVRARLVDVLARDRELEVVAVAGDGRRAVDLCAELRPDVITMDMDMPLMNGLEATRQVMREFPTPILIVSASTNRGDLFHTCDALASGAVDVLEKPAGIEPEGVWEERFVSTVKLVSRIRVVTRRQPSVRPAVPDAAWGVRSARVPCAALALGASTGGPAALAAVLGKLPRGFDVPVAFVLHVGTGFAAGFASWLAEQIHRPVTVAEHGQPVVPGQVVMAPPDRHLVLRGGRMLLDDGPARQSCRPSVDVLFESVAHEYGSAGAACLLTGMGRDGAAGLAEVRRHGGLTVAQDEASCAVYGMPGEAVRCGAAQRVLPPAEIGHLLSTLIFDPSVDARSTPTSSRAGI
jgi:two-component system, chemotaxis family, protein-glutamate methylesterase/glutaminase